MKIHLPPFAALRLCAILLLAASFSTALAEQKRIYIANDDHTDYMWSADADTYGEVFVDQIDFNLKLAEETAKNEFPYRNRYNCDGSYWLWEYEHRKSSAEFDHLMTKVKDGTISAPLTTLVSCYGGQPVEAVLRGMYYAGRLERRYDLRFPMALAMENQTLPLGLTSLFAGAGAKYSWRGICGCATKMDKEKFKQRPREIYWWAGHDGQKILLKWYSWAHLDLGGYWEAGKPVANIDLADKDPAFQKRHSDPKTGKTYQVIGIFGYGGDDLARKTGVTPPPPSLAAPSLPKVVSSPYNDHFHVIAQQQTNETRQIIVSNEQDFFEDFEKTHGASLDSKTVTYGNEWDLYSASMSETSARAKRAVEKLRSAELLAALVSLKYPAFMKNHTAARDRAFNALGLFWEHNWTADGPVSRPHRAAWQSEVVTQIESYVDAIQGEAIVRLGGMIPRPEKANRFFVLNPLGWSRTDAADFAYDGDQNIHVRDLTTGQDVAHQFVSLQGAKHLRILASDVPSAGYKVFEIQSGKSSKPTDASVKVTDSTLENDFVKIIVEKDGAISSLIDKKHSNTELAATINDLKINDFAAKTDEGEPLRILNSGPVSTTIRARSEAGVPHDTFITLYAHSDRVDIRNEIYANFADVRHWAFSFALDQPALHTEEVGTINLNKLQSQGGDYADTHARYDYLTVNHFADFTDASGKRGITLSNPDLAFGKLGNSTETLLDIGTAQLSMLAGGQVDGSSLGIRAQNGQTHFLQRFALRAHDGYDQTAAMKFALEHQNPFVTGPIISKTENLYPEAIFSLLSLNNEKTMLWTLKIHEDGIEHGIVARVWNQSASSINVKWTTATPLQKVQRITHIETPLEVVPLKDGTLTTTVAAQRMETFGLQLTSP